MKGYNPYSHHEVIDMMNDAAPWEGSPAVVVPKPETEKDTEEQFLNWVSFNVGVTIAFKKDCYPKNRAAVVQALKDLLWIDFVSDCHEVPEVRPAVGG